MPRGRMLNKKISIDVELNSLSVNGALIFSWCIAHLDVRGRILSNSMHIKGAVLPYKKEITPEIIEKELKQMFEKALVMIYGDGLYVQFLGFAGNQTISETKEAASIIPDPDVADIKHALEQVWSNSGVDIEQLRDKLSKVKLSKGNIRIDSGEPKIVSPQIESPIIMTFPCNGSLKEWHLRQDKISEYTDSFPAVNILIESKKARQWCIDNKTRRKTFRGMPAFLTRWFSKAQDSGGQNGSGKSKPGYGFKGDNTAGTVDTKKYDDAGIPD